jgi:hypothetical protein
MILLFSPVNSVEKTRLCPKAYGIFPLISNHCGGPRALLTYLNKRGEIIYKIQEGLGEGACCSAFQR